MSLAAIHHVKSPLHIVRDGVAALRHARMPATQSDKDKLVAEFNRARGYDLSVADRAARLRGIKGATPAC